METHSNKTEAHLNTRKHNQTRQGHTFKDKEAHSNKHGKTFKHDMEIYSYMTRSTFKDKERHSNKTKKRFQISQGKTKTIFLFY